MSLPQLMMLSGGLAGGSLSAFEAGYFLPSSYQTTTNGGMSNLVTDGGSGSYTIDVSSSGLSVISIYGVAGGGSGCVRKSNADWGGRGGNGGNSWYIEDLDVSSINSISISVGSGGAATATGGTGHIAGNTGDNTTVSVDGTIIATIQGGRGGQNVTGETPNTTNPASSIDVSGLTYNESVGNTGGQGGAPWNGGGGGGGAGGFSSNGGAGAPSRSSTGSAGSSTYGGAGGGGGEGGSAGSSTYGGDGAAPLNSHGGGGGGSYFPYIGNPSSTNGGTPGAASGASGAGGLHGGGSGGTNDGQINNSTTKQSGPGGDGAVLIIIKGTEAQLSLPIVDNSDQVT